jgi:hypothetical protein
MTACSELSPADLDALKAAVAHSPIVLRHLALARRLADWQVTRMAPDVDEVILAWLASQAPRRTPAALS